MKKKILRHKKARITIMLYDHNDEVKISHINGDDFTFPATAGASFFFDTKHCLDYLLTFRRDFLDDEYILHECWHLFFRYLAEIEPMDVSLEELGKEIYVYEFQQVYKEVKDALESLAKEKSNGSHL